MKLIADTILTACIHLVMLVLNFIHNGLQNVLNCINLVEEAYRTPLTSVSIDFTESFFFTNITWPPPPDFLELMAKPLK